MSGTRRRRIWNIGLASLLALGATSLTGCAIPALIGGMTESYRKTSTKEVKPETDVLEGKSFAVLVTADRSIEEMAPGISATLVARITQVLADPAHDAGTTGVVPPAMVIQYMYDHPGWRAKSMEDLAKDLGGVQRLVFVEISEFRTNEPGNKYIYDGVAAGSVAVVEADSKLSDYYSFERTILVKYPDEQGRRPEEIPEAAVRTELMRRFVDRVVWPFITHQEPYYPKY
ncbi:MAG: hypothetical protein JNM86_04745 [Phycisphaerae bacterium]|nr:hypothetical protein [Phycisphaerae bacterium]MBN8599142.1 hypothetical protein [Planctomycetota bacterium]